MPAHLSTELSASLAGARPTRAELGRAGGAQAGPAGPGSSVPGHRHQPAGPEQPPCGLLDDPDGVQPVLAAPERAGRVVLGDLGRDGGTDRYVRRVADHQIDRTAQRWQGAGEVTRVEGYPATGVR